jgi:hypothetical protein
MPRNYFRKTNPTIASDRQAKPPLTKATKGLIVLGVVAAFTLSYSLGVNNGTNSEKNALIASEKATYDTELATECSTLFGAVAVVDRQFSVTATTTSARTPSSSERSPQSRSRWWISTVWWHRTKSPTGLPLVKCGSWRRALRPAFLWVATSTRIYLR